MTDENLVSLETCFTVGGEISSKSYQSCLVSRLTPQIGRKVSCCGDQENECGASSTICRRRNAPNPGPIEEDRGKEGRDEKTEDEMPDANVPEAKRSISPADGKVSSETG